MHILIYVIEDQQYGLPLAKIKSVVLAVETTPLPNHSDYILGVINVHGTIAKVINTRKLVGQPEREIIPSDLFVICEVNAVLIALWVDSVKEIKKDIEDAPMIKDNEEIIFLNNLDALLEAHV